MEDKMIQIVSDVAKEMSNRLDELVKRKFIQNGFNPEDIEFLKTRVTRINNESNGAEEFYVDYNTKDQVRIITILPFDPLDDRDGKYFITRHYY